MKVMIRKANSEDMPYLLQELKEFSKFIDTKRQVFSNEEYIKTNLQLIMDKHVFLVAEIGALPVGFIAGFLTPHPMNPEINLLSEVFWWVDKAHRNTRAGLELLVAFIEHGKKHTDWITMTLESKSPVKEKALLRRGFRNMEYSYLLEV